MECSPFDKAYSLSLQRNCYIPFVLHAPDYAIDYSTKWRVRDLHTTFTVGLHEVNVMKSSGDIDYEESSFFLRHSRASETRACVNSPHARKARRGWEFLSHSRVSPFSPFSPEVIFTRARVSLALLSLRENGDSQSTGDRVQHFYLTA